MSFLAAERTSQTIISRWKMETVFRWKMEFCPDTPMETLVLHLTNTEDSQNRAGQSQTTPNTHYNKSVSILLLGVFGLSSGTFSGKKTRDAQWLFLLRFTVKSMNQARLNPIIPCASLPASCRHLPPGASMSPSDLR